MVFPPLNIYGKLGHDTDLPELAVNSKIIDQDLSSFEARDRFLHRV
jgi:hypothetical protein